jgi:serine protease Do
MGAMPSRSRYWSAVVVGLAAIVSMLAPAPALANPALDQIAQAPADAVAASAQVDPAVARIDTTINYQNAFAAGTGILLEPGGQVLTNYHVVQGADTITATVGGSPYPADLVGYDRKHDIAVLQLHGAGGLPTAPLGNSAQLAVGEPVVALGNAQGSDSPLTRETGTVAGFGRTINAQDEFTGSSNELTGLIEISAPVRAGDSGGPVVNGADQVVGLTTAATVNFRMGPAGQGFAIPINQALATAGQIRSGAPSDSVHIGPPTLLGVGVAVAQQRASAPGVIIRDVLSDGPAQHAGLISGDVLTTIDGTPLDSATTLTYVLDRHYPGDVVDLTWTDRLGQQRIGKATLTRGP